LNSQDLLPLQLKEEKEKQSFCAIAHMIEGTAPTVVSAGYCVACAIANSAFTLHKISPIYTQ
jgi:hypothetical protein